MIPLSERRGAATGVYFVSCEGFVKIGVSLDVTRRYNAIQHANPFDLAFMPTPTFLAAQTLEDELHHRFQAVFHRGEWFRDVKEIRDFIREHTQPWPMFTRFDDESDAGFRPYGAIVT